MDLESSDSRHEYVGTGQDDQPRPARDTHALPPDNICTAYWKYNKIKLADLDADPDVVDFTRGLSDQQKQKIKPAKVISAETIRKAGLDFKYYGQEIHSLGDEAEGASEMEVKECVVYEHDDFPGLQIYTQLLPPETQLLLLSRLLHRDLSNPRHKTNINADYSVPHPTFHGSPISYPPIGESSNNTTSSSYERAPSKFLSFFTLPPQLGSSNLLHPLTKADNLESTAKKEAKPPLTVSQFLLKKLRWLTLGTQYDWPTRSYPRPDPPSSESSNSAAVTSDISNTGITPFPPDIAALTRALFANTFEAQSGVVLLYAAKDYMPVHRDVSEMCERRLASFSLGCEGLFCLARDSVEGAGGDGTDVGQCADGGDAGDVQRRTETVTLRVRSGDVLVLDGEARWAWHAMPKVLANTCPDFMREWPVGSSGDVDIDLDDEQEGGMDERELREMQERAYEKWRGYMRTRRLNISCRQVFE